MIQERLKATLSRDENCNLKRHQVKEVDHIGWGINLEEELPDKLLEYLGVEDEDDIEEITQEQADYLRDYFIDLAVSDCVKIYGDELWNDMSDLRREVLANLSYNLGLPKLKAFRRMNAAIRAGDWDEAAVQMLDSKAACQTGDRYPRLAEAIRTNDEKHLELDTLYDDVSGENDSTMDEGLSQYSDTQLLNELMRRATG